MNEAEIETRSEGTRARDGSRQTDDTGKGACAQPEGRRRVQLKGGQLHGVRKDASTGINGCSSLLHRHTYYSSPPVPSSIRHRIYTTCMLPYSGAQRTQDEVCSQSVPKAFLFISARCSSLNGGDGPCEARAPYFVVIRICMTQHSRGTNQLDRQ